MPRPRMVTAAEVVDQYSVVWADEIKSSSEVGVGETAVLCNPRNPNGCLAPEWNYSSGEIPDLRLGDKIHDPADTDRCSPAVAPCNPEGLAHKYRSLRDHRS